MVLNCQSSDADNLNMRKRSHNALPLSGKVRDAPLNKKKKKKPQLYAEVANIYGINTFSIHKVVKKEKEICASFALVPQIAKAMATVHEKGLVSMENALNLYSKVFRWGRRRKGREREIAFT